MKTTISKASTPDSWYGPACSDLAHFPLRDTSGIIIMLTDKRQI